MDDITEIVNSLEESSLLLKGVSETIEIEEEKQRWGLLVMLLGTVGARLLGNMLAGKKVIWAGERVIWAGEVQDF